jgi:hypothetical protein
MATQKVEERRYDFSKWLIGLLFVMSSAVDLTVNRLLHLGTADTAEVIAYNVALNSSDRTIVREYLRLKYTVY